jgi:hypothetical protein
MFRRHNCVTDPTTKAWWRDYQAVIREGNPLGLSFVEYVATRVIAANPIPTYTAAPESPWYIAACGHSHLWGAACSTWTEA